MIIWITGISGSGKTTIASRLIEKYKNDFNNLVNVDGDIIRDLYENDLDYDIGSRIIQIKRIQKICCFLESQGLIVIASALYSNESLLKWNRKHFKSYYEIYLDASLDVVKYRDVKGLYKKYDKGLEKNIVGLDIPWNEPKNFDLKITMNRNTSLEDTIMRITKKLSIFKKKKNEFKNRL